MRRLASSKLRFKEDQGLPRHQYPYIVSSYSFTWPILLKLTPPLLFHTNISPHLNLIPCETDAHHDIARVGFSGMSLKDNPNEVSQRGWTSVTLCDTFPTINAFGQLIRSHSQSSMGLGHLLLVS